VVMVARCSLVGNEVVVTELVALDVTHVTDVSHMVGAANTAPFDDSQKKLW
jgi:hypothetical protein